MKVRVRRGDTFYYYSELFFTDAQLIIDSNRDAVSTELAIGEEIIIPGFRSERYTIKKGDTFWKLAAARHISVDGLLLLNQTKIPTNISVGDTVLLPRRVTDFTMQRKVNYDSRTLERDIAQLKELYPFITVSVIGKSVLQKPIERIVIGRGAKRVQINASFHANEWITTPILMKFMNAYLLSLTNQQPIRRLPMQRLYEEVQLTIVPLVNPDGVDLVMNGPPPQVKDAVLAINKGSSDFSQWKANIRGVDLNNQFPAQWEIEKRRKKPQGPAPRDYPGDASLTEPEAQALAQLAEQNNYMRVVALHTQGNEFYWGYEGDEPPESEVIAAEFARVSGYKPIRYIDSHAGYKDWFIQQFRKPGFTIELGSGMNPLPLSQFDDMYEAVLGIFLASLYM